MARYFLKALPMALSIASRVARDRRDTLRNEFWPFEQFWDAPNETGYFCAPRTLPLILSLLAKKSVSGNVNPGTVYLDLLSRHLGQGVVEMSAEDEHAFASGYEGQRAVRTWRDRMEILKERGFILTERRGNLRFGYVLLVHPTTVVERLRQEGVITDEWWNAYRSQQLEFREPTYAERFPPPTEDDEEDLPF